MYYINKLNVEKIDLYLCGIFALIVCNKKFFWSQAVVHNRL